MALRRCLDIRRFSRAFLAAAVGFGASVGASAEADRIDGGNQLGGRRQGFRGGTSAIERARRLGGVLAGVLAVLAPWCGSVTAARAAFLRAPQSPITVGGSPSALAVGDFNSDGKADLAVTNVNNDTVTVFLGDGRGSFEPASGMPFATGREPLNVAVGDYNRDGKADLAVANLQGKSVTVLLGDGAGGFTPSRGSPFPASGFDVVAGDFNGDGKPDLASCGSGVTILLGDGSGSFVPAPGSPVESALYGDCNLAAVDVNGDGKPDLLQANFRYNSVSVLLGDGAGGFSESTGAPFQAGGRPQHVAVGDLNGDGKPDLVVTDGGVPGPSGAKIFLGDGTGRFTEAPGSPYATEGPKPGGLDPVISDFNGDGKLDLATVRFTSTSVVSVLLGNAQGGFASATGSPFDAPTDESTAMVAADFNGDGKSDLAIASLTTNSVTILLNTGTSASLPQPRLQTKPLLHIRRGLHGSLRIIGRHFRAGVVILRQVGSQQVFARARVGARGSFAITVKGRFHRLKLVARERRLRASATLK